MTTPIPENTWIYHITDVANLASILRDGGLHSDAVMVGRGHEDIGYDHIKRRRLNNLLVSCCGNRFVGEFVPFYFCPRSPMLFTINKGSTGRPPGCQESIIYLCSTMAEAMALGSSWAFSDGNAGANYALFFNDPNQLNRLDWSAIRANDWKDKIHHKSAEFLVPDFFPWTAIKGIGCRTEKVVDQVRSLIESQTHKPTVAPKPGWYY
jgi:hypothetical protein